ncbi:Vegetative incompatibility protein HET-E-1 [Ceratocystis lukuohia]|uniref:Vegetative incompatibility protein HET-E-1 n=1 Tax=Ceratocystis lukuohia TaxID=2019550 RepID=A0ABR4M8V9_9PEZI
MASTTSPTTGQPLRILCLDGGGVRGLSSLLILENIMERIRELEGLSQVPSPCDRFDFIGGAGTGGIIAIMLGRLKMNVDDCIQAYKQLASSAFIPESAASTTSPSGFSTMKLEMAIKKMIHDNCRESQCLQRRRRGSSNPTTSTHTCDHDEMLYMNEQGTKTAVLAMTKANVDTLPTIFKTYGKSTHLTECKVWEVARATSAAIDFFDPIKLGCDDIEFIDASYGYSNPCEVLTMEAKNQFPDREMSILSISTGLGDVVEISDSKDSVLNALLKMATTSKYTDLKLRTAYSDTGVYHRFNVDNGLRDTTISDCHDTSRISAHTNNYLRENTHAVERFVTAFKNRIYHSKEDMKCLSDLYVTESHKNKQEIEQKKGGLITDCYQWIIDHKDFKRFLNEDESQILWIKGDPGKGKTMLLCGIINALAPDNSRALSYFFCQATNDQLNTATSVLRGLIHDLAHHYPQLTNMENVILIVNALDECGTDRQDLLKLIAKPSCAKWIVSSHNWPDIEAILNDAEQKVKIHLEINQHSVSAAVNSYVERKVDQLAQQKGYDDDTKMTVLKDLQSKANGTFLWVALVCEELANIETQPWHIQCELDSLPAGLYPLYGRMLEQISKSKHAKIYEEVIAIALVVYRPITVEELHRIVTPHGNLHRQNIRDTIAFCGSFLTIHKNVVSFIHQSAKDYFLEKASDKILPDGIPHQHQRMFLRSLEILDQSLRRDIYDLKAPGCLIDQVVVPQPDPLTPLRYPCIFWVDHLFDSVDNGIVTNKDKILAFFEKKYLQWLETLSLLRRISVAGRAMERLVSYLGQELETLQNIVIESRQFLFTHGGVIEIAPLQVYVSALVFTPSDTLIRKIFHQEEPTWVEVRPGVQAKWDACLQTLKGHDKYVTSVVFSNDGQRLASGSRNNTVKIWDVTSGACLKTLKGHDKYVTSMVFSNDGQRLASGSGDKTVKIWDASSGVCLQTLVGHSKPVVFSNDGQRLASSSDEKRVEIWDMTSPVCLKTLGGHGAALTSVVFSNDGQRLASGSLDNTVKIWDVTSGACLETIEHHHNSVRSVVFSKDGQRLASGSNDRTVKIWDATSGACLKTLEGHINWVRSVVFSNDGQRLASGSEDKTVKIWDATSGDCLNTLRGHDNRVTSVVISNDGQWLASGSDDWTVKIWHATSGDCLNTLRGHADFVTSVVLSNDGQRLASGSRDETVKIWDATSGACLNTLKGHDEWVRSAVFSNDGQRLASGSNDRTVRIWDATSGACLMTLKGHHHDVRSVVFSNDGQRLASGSEDKTVKIWDATSGACLNTLNSHRMIAKSIVFSNDNQRMVSRSVDNKLQIRDITTSAFLQISAGQSDNLASVVFSNDGQRLVSGSNDSTIKIWDATSGSCLQTLEGHAQAVISVVFSHDGQRLVSASRDKTVKIWDMASGACLETIEAHHSLVIPLMFSSHPQLASTLDNRGFFSPSNFRSCSISSDGVWVMENQQRMLWLPPSYRPSISAGSHNMVALGYDSGRITVIEIKSPR